MSEEYEIAIIGSGPGGLGAVARAAALGVPHILLERTDHLSDTIFKYSKGKPVMAHPGDLKLRCDVGFSEGSREDVLGVWNDGIGSLETNVRLNAEVTAVTRDSDGFSLTVNGVETIRARAVVLAIGLAGTPRTLNIEGSDWGGVQYQLDDPDEYSDETIVVVGAGDAAIENAVALTKNNNVVMINRRSEFARAKAENLSAIEAAISADDVECYYGASPKRVSPGELVVQMPNGEATISCDRIIARLGGVPPRKFVESMGIEFINENNDALPDLDETYQSSVSNLFVIGALGGYPLIKQALNQGYEVIEFILGNKIEPADEELLREKFGSLVNDQRGVSGVIDFIRERIPLVSDLTRLQLRELLHDSTFHEFRDSAFVFRKNDYSNSLYMILEGSLDVHVDDTAETFVRRMEPGAFVGEIGLIAGRRRTATVEALADTILIEIPRRSMIKLVSSVESVRRTLDRVAIRNQIRSYLSVRVSNEVLDSALSGAEIRGFETGQPLFHEGDEADGLFIIRRGSVTVSRDIGGQEVTLAYIPAGQYVGEMGLLRDTPRNATVTAAIQTETIWLPTDGFRSLLDSNPELRTDFEATFLRRLEDTESITSNSNVGRMIEFFVKQGIGEATDMLIIDESLCILCDNCEKACAETHGGTSRLNREAGPTIAAMHVPTSCRHCEHPHCMADCPPNSIHRAPGGEVYITDECIGCGNCVDNCPYDVIHMAPLQPKKPGLLSWMLFGLGSGPGQAEAAGLGGDGDKKAVKCDMCMDLPGDRPACVQSCPTGAAIRIKPEEFLTVSGLKQ